MAVARRREPEWPKGKPFAGHPTFEELLQRSGHKLTKLRELLRDVPRGRCSDNTVRYDAAAASAAIDGPEDADDGADAAAAAAVAEPLPTDPTQAALAVMNRTLALFSLVVRERGDVVRLCCDVIKTMGEPQKLGIDMVRETQAAMRERLGKLEGDWDRVVVLTEALQSSQGEREVTKQRAEQRTQMQRETFEMAKQYLPDALAKFQLTAKAGLALSMLQRIDPDMLEPVIDLAVPEDARDDARKLVALLRAERDKQQRDKQQPKPSPGPEVVDTKGEETPKESTQ